MQTIHVVLFDSARVYGIEGGCVCGEQRSFYCQDPLEDYYASKEEVNSCFEVPESFVLQALTSNIRRDNKCSAAFVVWMARHLIYAPQLGGPNPKSHSANSISGPFSNYFLIFMKLLQFFVLIGTSIKFHNFLFKKVPHKKLN